MGAVGSTDFGYLKANSQMRRQPVRMPTEVEQYTL